MIWSHRGGRTQPLDSEASEMFKNYPPLTPFLFISKEVHHGWLAEVRQAERKERLFSLRGPVSSYSFYANKGDPDVSLH